MARYSSFRLTANCLAPAKAILITIIIIECLCYSAMCSRVHSDPVKPGCFGGLEVASSTPMQAQIVAPADLIRSAAIAVSASRVEAAVISLIAGLDFATN